MKYKELVDTYIKIEETSKRLNKTGIIAELLKKTPEKDIPGVILLLQGRVFPLWDRRKLGIAAKLILKAIHLATGFSTEKIEESWRKTGDLGITAKKLVEKKKQSTLISVDLELSKVILNLAKLAEIEGNGSADRKIALVAELLTSAKASEAQYIVRTVLEDLRVGAGNSSIRDAIVWAYAGKNLGIKNTSKEWIIESREEYNKYIEAVQEAYDITSDFSRIAGILRDEGYSGLKKISLEIGKPIKAMLVQKADNIEAAFEKVGKPAVFEYKYDGFRLQIHKINNKVLLYTRSLEDVTTQFSDIVEIILKKVRAEHVILDSEAVGINRNTGKCMPFQSISQRIRRKHDIEKIKNELPVEVNVFDLLYLNGENMLKTPFLKRREKLNKIIRQEPKALVLATQIVTEKGKEAEEFYKSALQTGNEGVIAKNIDSPYKPGSRVGFCVKIKPVMKSLELVIVAAEWGEGKRANWLTSFTLACKTEDGLKEIGKVGTGIKELKSEGTSFDELTELLRPFIIGQKAHMVKVSPKIVIEVSYEEIQSSPSYSSGYALRFPRFIRLREDRTPEDIDTLKTIEELYKTQKHR